MQIIMIINIGGHPLDGGIEKSLFPLLKFSKILYSALGNPPFL
jgi:hypothetical protein